ncbi:MAG: elongation factor 4 [Candidatus Kerfeldbacteria bacterium CG_4_10_14_0_8_um_filter_42_10]|uniref:Elongation factor 4 n=1 Tax=Candidatus Kerfeldbacteria bacterium CG_4_10_14_0_8_um_filter_42_10 TaxID=2014248 RepID=A0A2M7RIU1_9BACT|nr:MAG: elongation factor 4 [Candidatus Kerfeldbacteria bacterium CG_4_10_14_0_8_um_filter_42_10]
MNNIRNFCIIAHIDHGKSTLADRLLEFTGTVEKRKMREQLLDQMDLERERGITIKLQPVRMVYQLQTTSYILNLIDTPGHVDFSYEVSRSLSAVEGALLLVDATQGIQAQTLANLYQALALNLVIIPIINKIDLPNAEPAKVANELSNLLGVKSEEIILASAKTGQGVEKIIQKIITDIPAPKSTGGGRLKALIFDSYFDEYQGVVALIRIMEGSLEKNDLIHFMATGKDATALSLGYLKPQLEPVAKISEGEIGCLISGLKTVKDCRVGDTVVLTSEKEQAQPLPGYQVVKPMVFAGFFPKEGEDSGRLREALEKLHLSDSAFTFVPEKSSGLGLGFRCGFLGILHLDIVQERLRREYDLAVVVTVPSVAYEVKLKSGEELVVNSPSDFPEEGTIEKIQEPWMKVDIITPAHYQGVVMEMVLKRMGKYLTTEYLEQNRVILHFELPLTSLIVDFYDKLKSVTSGYASLNYDFAGMKETNIRRLDILVAGEQMEALATFVYENSAYETARRIAQTLKEAIPPQLFEIRIQAVLGYQKQAGIKSNAGGKIIASERISPMRKDVTAKLYGGDVTRKRKLLEKQKKGKKRMRSQGKVEIPSSAYLSVLRGK